MSRIFLVLVIAWTATTAPVGAESPPEAGSSPANTTKPDEPRPAATQHGADERFLEEDEELIRNLDLIEHLDLLDTVEVLGAVNAPDTAEEEF